MRGLRVTVQASDYKVNHDPVEQHHARANDGQHRGPHALVFATPTRVNKQREHNEGVTPLTSARLPHQPTTTEPL